MVRDGIIVLLLVLAAIVLYAITAFLFGSFTQRRAELGKQFGESGKQLLARGDSAGAIHDLRISLSYAPDDASSQLLLAEALAQANHWDEARSYFVSLLDLQPADGFINLQLARLARRKNDAQEAIEYYRAAAVGNWPNAPLDARFQAQFELANYLIAQHRLPAARAELLIASADSPVTTDAYLELGDRFVEANDQGDAVNQYERAIKLDPQNMPAVLSTARLFYNAGKYAETYKLLSGAHRTSAAMNDAESIELRTLMDDSRRIQELAVGQNLPARQRKEHLLTDVSIAKQRFTACRAKVSAGTAMPAAMQSLDAEWNGAETILHARAALDDQTNELTTTKLVFDTEELTEKFCGPPVGDDALLLTLADASNSQH